MTNSLTMKSKIVRITLFLSAGLILSPLAKAQESDPDLDKALKQAEEQSKKMGIKAPDVKAQLAEVEQDEAKEKAALQKQLEAPGPVALPFGHRRFRNSLPTVRRGKSSSTIR